MKHIFALLLCGLLLAGCNREDCAQPHELLRANLWMQSSAEYAANSIQTYNTAKALLPAALADSTWTASVEQGAGYYSLPPAVVLDVDETVLDNTAYEARLIVKGTGYPEGWTEWCNEALAPALPGVRDFLRYARAKGVAIFYVTNRGNELEEVTRQNLINERLPLNVSSDHLLTLDEQEGWGSDKSSRREFIARTHRIVMLFGDNFNDFASGTRVPLAKRRALAESLTGFWGTKWFMLANPAYGDWESAIYDFNRPKTAKAQLKAKFDALETFEIAE